MKIQLGGRGSVRDRGRGGRNKEIPQRDETSVIDGDCSGHLSHCIKHHQFNCVNMAPGSTEAIHYVAEPLCPAETTQILLDHISPAALPSVKFISFTLHNQCCYRHSRFIFLGSTDPSWRWGKQTMWLLLSNTSTPSCLPAAFLSRFLFGFMTPQYALIKCYDSKQLHSACCKGHGTGVRVTMATTIDKTQTHTLTCKHTHEAPESYVTIKYCLLNENYATKWNHCTDWTAHSSQTHMTRGLKSILLHFKGS